MQQSNWFSSVFGNGIFNYIAQFLIFGGFLGFCYYLSKKYPPKRCKCGRVIEERDEVIN